MSKNSDERKTCVDVRISKNKHTGELALGRGEHGVPVVIAVEVCEDAPHIAWGRLYGDAGLVFFHRCLFVVGFREGWLGVVCCAEGVGLM